MTLTELSCTYADSASAIHTRILELRRQASEETDSETIWRLQTRIWALLPLLQDMRELSAATSHYYDRRDS